FDWPFQASSGTASVARIATDPSGNILALVSYEGQVDIDPGPGTTYVSSSSTSDGDLAVVKLDPTGRLLWYAPLASPGYERPNKPATDQLGNVYVAGNEGGGADFDPGPGQVKPNTSSTFVWKLSPEGQLLWVYEPHGQSSYPALAVRPDGVVLLGS